MSFGRLNEAYCLFTLLIAINNLMYFSNANDEEPNSGQPLMIDPEGYTMFCPCMGRFGNQADQFLGALAFAKQLNRTFVIPHWVEYIPYASGSNQVPFSKYFKVEGIQSYHKSIPMDIFMDKVAPRIWPANKRIAFCYIERGRGKGCDAKEGNPFGPFWDKFGIDFVGSEIYGPDLHYLIDDPAKFNGWTKKYSGKKWPVLAFVGPPSAFPVEEKNVHLQQYFIWNDEMSSKVQRFIKTLPKGPFIGIHLRNGLDWSRACELVDGTRHIFASPQCTGYHNEFGSLTSDMCLPSTRIIIKQLKRAVKKRNATAIFVASDRNHLKTELTEAFKKLGVSVHESQFNSPHLDLAVLGQANLFIGNCVSSFSAFVKRERDVNGFPSEFWSFPPEPKVRKTREHVEL